MDSPRLTVGGDESTTAVQPGVESSKEALRRMSGSVDSGFESEQSVSDRNAIDSTESHKGRIKYMQQCPEIDSSSNPFSLYSFSIKELRAIILDSPSRENKITQLSQLLRTLVSMGECQLSPGDRGKLLELLDTICKADSGPWHSELYPPLRFKDAVGRKFSVPWHLGRTWAVGHSNFPHRGPFTNDLPENGEVDTGTVTAL
jgi:hypothetical protein